MIGHNHLGKNGRFGNQMFQYAATRGIAAKHEYNWCIPPGPKTDDEFEDEENQHKLFMAFEMGGVKEVNMHPAPYKEEGSFTFDQDLFDNCEDNVNLYGYFQSEKYFKHIEDEIRKDFEWKDDVKKLCKDMIDGLHVDQLISLHVRRTDHLVKPTYHPVLPLSYYEEALSKFPSDIPVLVFSSVSKATTHSRPRLALDRNSSNSLEYPFLNIPPSLKTRGGSSTSASSNFSETCL